MYAKPFNIFLLLVGLVLASACNRVPTTPAAKEAAPEVEQMKDDFLSGKMTAVETLIQRLEMRNVMVTDEQKRRIAEIGSNYDLSMEDKASRRKQVRQLMQQVEKEVLTPEQAEQLRQGSGTGKRGG